MKSSDAWFERMNRAFVEDRLLEHARALRAEGLPVSRIALMICVFLERELRVRGRDAETARLVAAAPEVLEALGCGISRLEEALRERRLLETVVALHDREGWSKARIISALKSFSVLLGAQRRDDEAVLAVLDRLTGHGARELQLWPHEVDE
jgi:hypothetical protein